MTDGKFTGEVVGFVPIKRQTFRYTAAVLRMSQKTAFMATIATLNRPYVFLTGATGLVGGLVLARLLSFGLPVAVMVRGHRKQSASERVASLMQRLEGRFGQLFTRPVVLDGDLVSPGLGMSPGDREWIAKNCDSVIHSAANLLFRPAVDHPENEPYRTNVEGTRQLLELMTSAGITEWHYVSTAYIAGLRSGRILEGEFDVGQEFGNDYERSKLMCEQLLRSSSSIHSLTVYRPSIVIDLQQKASIRADKTIDSAFAMFKALSQRFGLPEQGDWFRRLGFSGNERKNIVTVDWVSAMIVQIYRRPALHRQTYHLTSPTGTSVGELEGGFRAAVVDGGVKLPEGRIEVPALFNEQAAPFVAAFKPYFKDDPVFDRTNITNAMGVCGESELANLTVGALGDFYRQQAKPTVPVTQPSLPSSVWDSFVAVTTRGDLASNVVAFNAAAKHDRHLLGLELVGAGGGQWLLEESASGWLAIVGWPGSASIRFVVSAETMSRLTDRALSVHLAIEAGLIVLEVDASDDGVLTRGETSNIDAAIERFARLIAEVQQTAKQEVLKSEVANVH